MHMHVTAQFESFTILRRNASYRPARYVVCTRAQVQTNSIYSNIYYVGAATEATEPPQRGSALQISTLAPAFPTTYRIMSARKCSGHT